MGSNDRFFCVVSCNDRGGAGAGAGAGAEEAEAAVGPEEDLPSDCAFVNRRSFSHIHRFTSTM
ncbi:hypothetical protein L484_025518 [Morus notabilis]|uniref:Uncharacterized protein n=1 Tax=Morus notabilis TaxID=981085 RepID=W9RP35_9ROSA|nr:hypothetical protein L484_025518 [Morus notabilis]